MESYVAGSLRQEDYNALLANRGYVTCGPDPAVLFCIKLDARFPVRGDDFMLLGDAAAVGGIHRLLKTKHTAKLIVNIGETKNTKL